MYFGRLVPYVLNDNMESIPWKKFQYGNFTVIIGKTRGWVGKGRKEVYFIRSRTRLAEIFLLKASQYSASINVPVHLNSGICFNGRRKIYI